MSLLRVATFNLLHGLSLRDGQARPEDLRLAAATLDADVVGLQEVDRGQPRSGSVDQTEVVASTLDAPTYRFVASVHGTPGVAGAWTAAPADDDDTGEIPAYGVGLVSRLPVRSWHVLRFPAAPFGMPLLVPGRRRPVRVMDEPRVALAAVLDGPGGTMTVLTAHLSFVPGVNVRQLRAVTRWAAGFPGPRVLAGDCNLPGTLPRRLTGWQQLARVATYPAGRPRIQFDHVLGVALPPDAVRRARALSLPVSDHCALVVDLEL